MIQMNTYLESNRISKAKGVHSHKDVVLPSFKSNVINLFDWKRNKEKEEDYVLHKTSIKFY